MDTVQISATARKAIDHIKRGNIEQTADPITDSQAVSLAVTFFSMVADRFMTDEQLDYLNIAMSIAYGEKRSGQEDSKLD